VARIDNIVEGIINDYKVKVEALIEVYFEVIAKKKYYVYKKLNC